MEVELYLHGLKWKNYQISERDFAAGHFLLYTTRFINNEIEEGIATFRIRQCGFNHRLEMYGEMKPPELENIPIDNAERREINGVQSITFTWYRAYCDEPAFFVTEEGELSFRDISTNSQPEKVKRFFPDVQKEPKIKSNPVPQKKLTIFDYIDLE